MVKRQVTVLPRPLAGGLDAIRDALVAVASGGGQEAIGAYNEAVGSALKAACEAAPRDEMCRPVDLGGVIASRVRQCRVQSGWSQQRIADAMGRLGFPWKRLTVVEVEGGGRRVQLEELLGLAVLFGVGLTSFLRLDPDEVLLALPGDELGLSQAEVEQLIMGPGEGSAGDEWTVPRSIARIGSGPDWRPAGAYWDTERRRRANENESRRRWAQMAGAAEVGDA